MKKKNLVVKSKKSALVMRSVKSVMRVSLALLLAVSAGVLPAAANSAWTDCKGTTATGTIITDEDCPLEVEHESLTVDVQEFPETYYYSYADFLAYSGKVTAEYTFYNPAEYAVEATLVFPFGTIPGYGDMQYQEYEASVLKADTEKYDVTVNGEVIEKTLRHTLTIHDAEFVLETDLQRLHDNYVEDSFYSPELPVTKYTYRAENYDTDRYSTESASFVLSEDASKTKVLVIGQRGQNELDKGEGVRVYGRAKEETFVLYVMGEPLSKEPEWEFYTDYYFTEKTDAKMTLVSKETQALTFKDLAFMEYREETGISEVDWYNAFVELLRDREIRNGAIRSLSVHFDLAPQMMRWYEYKINVEPGERIINTVTAPMYPAITGGGSDLDYTYTYLLSPAKSWAAFGDLEIRIQTPFEMRYCSLDGFELLGQASADAGTSSAEASSTGEIAVAAEDEPAEGSVYYLHLDGLPDDELEFMLVKPKVEDGKNGGYRGLKRGDSGSSLSKMIVRVATILLGIFVVVFGLIIFAIVRLVSRKKR